MTFLAEIEPWWSAAQSGTVGGLLGGGLGTLCGLVGAMTGLLAPKGRAKWLVVPFHALLLAAGLISGVVGAVAIGLGQPYHVYYPLLLSGCVLTCVLGGLFPLVLMTYRIADACRQEAGADGEPARPACPPMNQFAPARPSPAMMNAIVDMWGEGRPYRRWCRTVALLAGAVGGIGLLWSAANVLRSEPPTSWLPPLIIGFEFAVLGGVSLLFAIVMGAQVRQIQQITERQRLDAAEFRRA